VDDKMPAVLWTCLFLEAQGYEVNENIIFQDYQSAILLQRNGKASSSKRTKHLNIRYFFVTDRIKKGDLSVEWCPTGDMTGDFMTKPNQGALFRKFRDQIMGVVPAQDPGPGKPKVSKPVGKTNNVSGMGKRRKEGNGNPQECVRVRANNPSSSNSSKRVSSKDPLGVE
jgi:hypothetical protein